MHFRNVGSFHQNADRSAVAALRARAAEARVSSLGQLQAPEFGAAELGVQNERGLPGRALHIHDVKQRSVLRPRRAFLAPGAYMRDS